MALKLLPKSTIKLIGSSQVVTSVSSAVKELVENSIDAGATSIDIRLENYGLDKIEIKDDGCGISESDVQYMCQRSYTSKINDFSDLDRLSSYGFRGEALNSLCALGKVSVTTKTETDSVAKCYTLDHNGTVINSKLSHIIKGTIILVEGLFRNLPVRRQFLSNGRRKSEEMKKTEAVVKCLAVIHPRVRVTLVHNKCCIWQKNQVPTLRQSLVQMVPPTMVKQLHDLVYEDEQMKFDMLIPRKDCNISTLCYGNTQEAVFLFINSRPVRDRHIDKAIQDEIFLYFGHYIPQGKHPLCLVSIKLPSHALDVNLEPNKTKVLVKDMEALISKLKNQLLLYYVGDSLVNKQTDVSEENESKEIPVMGKEEKPRMKRKAEEEYTVVAEIDSDDEIKPKVARTEHQEIESMETIAESEMEIDKPANSIIKDTSENITCENLCEADISLSIQNDDSSEKLPNTVQDESAREKNICKFLDGLFEEMKREQDDKKIQEEMGAKELALSETSDEETHAISGKSDNYEPVMSPQKEIESCSLEDITLSQWSRGEVFHNNKLIKSPSKVVGTNYLADLQFTQESQSSSQGDNTQNRSVSSQMGCKEMSAFTKFAREMRTKLTQETPGISFTKVASELASRWRNLHNSEKEDYEKKAKEEKLQKANSKDKTEGVNNEKQTKLTQSKLPNLPRRRNYWKSEKSIISMEFLKASIEKSKKERIKPELDFLGKLNEDIICCRVDSRLKAVSLTRLQEALCYHQNLARMCIPVKVLEENISILESDIDEELWELMLSMETAIDSRLGTQIISDERITKNGLRIEVIEGAGGVVFQITDVPSNIAFYGLEDLKEILRLINGNRYVCKLFDCRPLKAITYIRSETIRQLAKVEKKLENPREELRYWFKNIKKYSENCPHHNPVMHEITSL